METALAAPHRGHQPDGLAANHAFVLLLRQLLDQTPCGIGAPIKSLVPYENSQSNVVEGQLWYLQRFNLTCLCLFALWHFVPFLLAWSVVLLVCSSPPSSLGCVPS